MRDIVIATSDYIRNVIIRAVLFTNCYNLISSVYLRYSVCQLAGGRKITSRVNVPDNMLSSWDSYCDLFPQAIHDGHLPIGASHPLSAACVEMATSYTNHMVENFESRLFAFIKYRLQNIFTINHDVYFSVTGSNTFVICRICLEKTYP